MPRVIYVNIVWFGIVMVATTAASITRHRSSFWGDMPEVRTQYDIYFVGVFGLLCTASVVGLLKRKRWGYEWAMNFNYVLSFLALIPVAGLLIFSFKNDIPLQDISASGWGVSIENLIVSIVSLLFVVLMRRPHVKSVF